MGLLGGSETTPWPDDVAPPPRGAKILSWRAVISPIAAGNTAVVKPSEFAPVNAGIVIAEEAGFPPGVINVVTHAPGAAPAISDVVLDSPDVRVINLIGGVRTARILAKPAGETSSERCSSLAASTRCPCSTTSTATTRCGRRRSASTTPSPRTRRRSVRWCSWGSGRGGRGRGGKTGCWCARGLATAPPTVSLYGARGPHECAAVTAGSR